MVVVFCFDVFVDVFFVYFDGNDNFFIYCDR